MDSLINQILFYTPLIAILVSFISIIVSINGLLLVKKKLKERKNSYHKMDNDFNDIKERVQKELKKN